MRRFTIFYCLILFCSAYLTAEDIHIAFTYELTDYDPAPIIDSLVDGHRAEIRYEIRIYQAITGLKRIFGDRRIAEHEVVYVARWNALNQEFAVRVNGETEVVFEDTDSLIEFLLAVREQRVSVSSEFIEDLYILCRPWIQPIKLVPPLTLMILIRPEFRQILPWQEVPFRIVE